MSEDFHSSSPYSECKSRQVFCNNFFVSPHCLAVVGNATVCPCDSEFVVSLQRCRNGESEYVLRCFFYYCAEV
ncbi:hypothetical protein ACFX2C_014711 [Malus domestica]